MVAAASTRRGLSHRDRQQSLIVPIESGTGTAATRLPKPSTSTPRLRPQSPRLCRYPRATGPASAVSCRSGQQPPVVGRRLVPTSSRRPPSARNSPFRVRPDKWAPTTATATSLSASEIDNGASGLRTIKCAEWQPIIGMEHATDFGKPARRTPRRQQHKCQMARPGSVTEAGIANRQRSRRLTKFV